MAKFRAQFKKGFDVMSLVKAIFITLVSLWVGGLLLNALGAVMNGTTSPFYAGLTFIGWTVDATNTITSTTSGTGILVVVGIIAMAALIMKFVKFSWR